MIRGIRVISRAAVAVALSAGLVCATATGASASPLPDDTGIGGVLDPVMDLISGLIG
jgi:hypothetical protein